MNLILIKLVIETKLSFKISQLLDLFMLLCNQISKNNAVGSSISSLTFTKNVTDVEPSMMR